MRFAVLFLLGVSFAGAGERFRLKVGNETVEFVRYPEKHLVLSANCQQENGSLSCEAYSALTKLSSSREPLKHSRGGANPGAVLCARKLGGKVVIGVDEKGNQQSFCLFSDQSYVSSGSISHILSAHRGFPSAAKSSSASNAVVAEAVDDQSNESKITLSRSLLHERPVRQAPKPGSIAKACASIAGANGARIAARNLRTAGIDSIRQRTYLAVLGASHGQKLVTLKRRLVLAGKAGGNAVGFLKTTECAIGIHDAFFGSVEVGVDLFGPRPFDAAIGDRFPVCARERERPIALELSFSRG